jgi:hypothetical protein
MGREQILLVPDYAKESFERIVPKGGGYVIDQWTVLRWVTEGETISGRFFPPKICVLETTESPPEKYCPWCGRVL